MNDSNTIHALAYFNLLKTSSWIEEKVKDALKPYNLTHAQLNALHILMEHDPIPVSANDIKSRILVNNPDVTRLLDRLVKKGLVRRETCPDNRRKIDVSITQNGKKIFSDTRSSLDATLGNFFEDRLTIQEAKELRNIMHKIRK